MTRQTIAAAFLSIAATLIATSAAQADDIVLQTDSYDSPNGYDYSSGFPPTTATTIGAYTFSPLGLNLVTGITISGTFGNGDSDTTALSDYYLGDASDGETAVTVAGCDDPTNSCSEDDGGPTNWTWTLTQPQIADLVNGLDNGSLDFTYTWDSAPPATPTPGFPQYVYAGAATIDISYTPEPATVLICFSGIAGIVALRRFRKV